MTIKKGTLIIAKKVSSVDGAEFPTPAKSDYIPGIINEGVSVPIDYEVEGILLSDLAVGLPMHLVRHRRNNVRAFGEMATSPITSIIEDEQQIIAHTLNSKYLITFPQEIIHSALAVN